jgi:hypothetical protein
LKVRHGGSHPDEMRRLTALEDENARLKTIDADLGLDREMRSVAEGALPRSSTGSDGGCLQVPSGSVWFGEWSAVSGGQTEVPR